MVFFTCNACGESLKKAQVEKHLLKCRGCRVLSCIDCSKDFCGDDYKNHNKCISEDQKYGGRDFQAKANKGDVKQQQWIERIQEAIGRTGVDSSVQQVLYKISAYDNVPRKKAKFENWMKSCLKIYSPVLHQQVWEVLSLSSESDGSQTNHQTSEGENQSILNNGSQANGDETHTRKNKKSKRKTSEEHNGETCEKQAGKKRKHEQNSDKKRQKKRKQEASDESPNAEEETVQQESESNSTGKFNWKGTIKALLRDAPEDGLAVKKLRKKVLSAYYSFSGHGNYRSEEELLSLFNRKINNNPKFRILKDKVRLVK